MRFILFKAKTLLVLALFWDVCDSVFHIFLFRAWCRLLVYPQIVLFSSMHVARTIIGHKGKFYFLFNGMLAFLYGLNLYWFHFILMLIIRLITGKAKGVEDTREFDQNSKTNVNGVHQNGLTKSKFSFF